MQGIKTRRKGFVSRLLRDKSAVAYIEFAYTLPCMIALFMGGSEVAMLAITHTRVSEITHQTADNASRVRDRIDETDMNELLLGTKLAGASIDLLTHGRVIVSSVEDNAATTNNTQDQVIVWQRCKGLKGVSSSYGLEGAVLPGAIGSGTRTIQAMPGNPVIFVEVQYDYQPLFSDKILGEQIIKYTSANSVRDRTDNTMQNGKNLSGTNKPTCNYFNDTFN